MIKVKNQDLKVFLLIVSIGIVGIITCAYIYSVPLANPPIRSDGHGYYMYLPATWIYKDIGMHFLNQIQDVGYFATTYFQSATGCMVDKYTVGVAVLETPFFLIAHVFTLLLRPGQADGFSSFYQYANIVSACFYYVVGAWFSFKIAKKFTAGKIAATAVLLITFGTNLFHYFTFDASFSHIYSFAAIAVFYWLILKYEEHHTRTLQFLGGVCFGLVVICRVPNALVILLYIFYGVTSWKSFWDRMKEIIKPKNWIFIAAGIFVAVLPQLIYWYITTGHFIINSYSFGGNTFDQGFKYWNNPQIFNILFSVKKGIFFWCPVLLCTLIGGTQIKKLKSVFTGIIIFSIAFIYMTASWWAWSMGGGFSHRAFVDIMVIFIILMAVFLEKISKIKNKSIKVMVCVFIALAVLWNIMAMIAYWKGIIQAGILSLPEVNTMIEWYIQLFIK